jgi:hypothetical protein
VKDDSDPTPWFFLSVLSLLALSSLVCDSPCAASKVCLHVDEHTRISVYYSLAILIIETVELLCNLLRSFISIYTIISYILNLFSDKLNHNKIYNKIIFNKIIDPSSSDTSW